MYSPEDDFLLDDDYYYHKTPGLSSYSTSNHVARALATREANEHLQRLHRRVVDLEDVIRSQGLALSEKDAGHRLLRNQLKELKEIKERQIKELREAIAALEDRNRDLDLEVKKKAEGLEDCQRKLLLLDRLVSTQLPSIEKFVANLKKINAGNAAKIKAMAAEEAVGASSTMSATITSSSASSVRPSDPVNGIVGVISTGAADHVSDSGHPSSASDNALEDVSRKSSYALPNNNNNNNEKLLSDIERDLSGSISQRSSSATVVPTSVVDGVITDGVDQRFRSSSTSSVSPAKHHPRVRNHRKNPSPGAVAAVNGKMEMAFMSGAEVLLSRGSVRSFIQTSPNHGPYTPPATRRHISSHFMSSSVGRPTHPFLSSSSSSSHESPSSSLHHSREVFIPDLDTDLSGRHGGPTSITSSAALMMVGDPTTAVSTALNNNNNFISGQLSSDVGKILNFSDEEVDTSSYDLEPPAPAPPPSSNKNENLPSIQRRFLPNLSIRY